MPELLIAMLDSNRIPNIFGRLHDPPVGGIVQTGGNGGQARKHGDLDVDLARNLAQLLKPMRACASSPCRPIAASRMR